MDTESQRSLAALPGTTVYQTKPAQTVTLPGKPITVTLPGQVTTSYSTVTKERPASTVRLAPAHE